MRNVIARINHTVAEPLRIIFSSPQADQLKFGEFVYYKQKIGGAAHQIICQVVTRKPIWTRMTNVPFETGDYWVEAQVVGYYDAQAGFLVNPRQLPPLSAPIGRPPAGLLTDALFKTRPDVSGAATIGTLVNRADVPVTLDLNVLISHHAAILGSDAADTSPLTEALITTLIGEYNRASVVVIDPSGELVFQLNSQIHDHIPHVRNVAPGRFTNRIGELTMPALFSILRPMADGTESILYSAYEQVRRRSEERYGEPERWTLEELLSTLEEMGEATLAQRLRASLGEPRLFHDTRQTPLAQICQPGFCSVLCLAGSTSGEQQLFAATLLRRIEAVDWDQPTFVFINEAHRFVPAESSPTSKQTIAEMTRCRRGKIGICLVSAQPGLLDGDVLSQVDTVLLTQITNHDAYEHVARDAHMLSQEMLDMLPALEGGQAIVAGLPLNTPVIMERQRHCVSGISQSAGVPPEWMARIGNGD